MNRAFHVGGIVCFLTVLLMGSGVFPTLPALFLAFVCAIFLFKRKLPLWVYASATAFCVCAVAFSLWQAAVITPAQAFVGTTKELRGVVVDKTIYPGNAVIVIRNDSEGLPRGLAGARVRIRTQDALEAEVGNVVHYTAELDCQKEKRMRLYAKGIRFQGYLAGENPFKVVGDAKGFPVAMARYRAGIQSNLRRLLIGEEGDTLICMLTADGTEISPLLRDAYARAGVAHLLAVSGLHLSVLSGLLALVLRRLRLSHKERAVLTIAAIVLFLGLTGFPYPLLRAGAMLAVSSAAVLLGRDSDALNSLGFAATLILVCNPYAAFSVSFQLSYLSTMGIAAFSTPLSNGICRYLTGKTLYTQETVNPWTTCLLEAISVTLCASTAILPLICWNFGQISLVSLPANLMVGPAMTVLLAAGIICGVCGFFPALSVVYRTSGLVAGAAMRMVNDTVERWAALPYAALPLRGDSAIFWMAAALLLGWALYAFRAVPAVKRYAAALMLLPLLAGQLAHAVAWGDTMAMAVPANGGSLALAYGKQAVVVGRPLYLRETRNLCVFLRDYGVERISLLVLPKENSRDSTPVAQLMEAFPVDTVVTLDGERSRFEARAFGRAHLLSMEDGSVQIDLDGTRIVKQFTVDTARTDLLVDNTNDVIFAPGINRRTNDRYYDSVVVTFRARPLKPGYRPNNQLEANANEVYSGDGFFKARKRP